MNDTKNKKPFSTHFGISFPKWKDEKIGAGAAMLTFVLQGRLISKKNRQMAIVSRKDAENWLSEREKKVKKLTYADFKTALSMTKAQFIGNKQYQEAKRTFVPVLEDQRKVWEARLGGKGLKFPIKKAAMTIRFYFRDKHITDTVNKQQTVQDLLILAGIIANDDYKSLNPITSASARYTTGVRDNTAVVRLSLKLPKKKVGTLTDEIK